jgi:hypothetical protein
MNRIPLIVAVTCIVIVRRNRNISVYKERETYIVLILNMNKILYMDIICMYSQRFNNPRVNHFYIIVGGCTHM